MREVIKKIVKALLVLIFCTIVIILTIRAASKGDAYLFLILLATYACIFLIMEKMMKSFVGPTKPTIFSHNKTVKSRIIEISNMFVRAEKYIDIVSECLKKEVYANEEVISALINAIEKRNVKVEIITEDEVESEVLKLIEEKIKNGDILLYRLPGYKVSRHFIVVDGIEVRIEKKHGPNYEERKASYWFFYRRLGYHIKNKFEAIKKEAIPITLKSS